MNKFNELICRLRPIAGLTVLFLILILSAGPACSPFRTVVHAAGSAVLQDSDDQDVDQTDSQRRSELGERQRLVERKMATLESMFESIAQKLQVTDPEKAERLGLALQHAKENLIKRKMGQVTQLLDAGRLSEAERTMDEVIESLESLIRLLLNQKEETSSKEKQIEDLERWKRQIEELRKEEQRQRIETQKVANKDDALDTLAKQAQEIKELIEKQKQVIQETERHQDSGLQALDKVADMQFKVRQQTEDLEKRIAESFGADAAGDAEGEARPDDSGENSGNPAGDPAPNQGDKPSDSGQPQSGQPQSGQPQSGQPQSGQPSGSQQQPAPGQKPLQQASKHQRDAEEKLGRGKSDEAQRAEERALSELQKALDEIEREKKRIESLPPDALKEMAKAQRRTKDKTADVANEMKKAPSAADSEQQESGQKQPGQQNVENAQKSMDNAAGDLDDDEPQRAERQQRKAEEELEKALQEIEDRLAQLREETREEKLRRLEARFREMLTRQQLASELTSELHDKQTFLGRLRRRDTLALFRLASEEREISELGQQAYDLLLEDGTSIVFPEMVQDVREDLNRVAKLLEADETGALTQMIQQQIEVTLEELLDALKQARQQRENQGGGGGGGGNQPLLRKSAELKMLRAAQLRVNRRTKQIDLIRGNDRLEPMMRQEVQSIAERQRQITEMTLRVLEDN
ncbi:MAG TPA: hypothetical protein PKD64_14265 [Pirellulaceae bacterium]|nr:hypothetical protein [Pirellulaceae bacterium]HMO93351.1 hypothetical protein [Pirellulaceae bacterium]HMP70122.1 hypothetical protein [Pirellulaceae bacterium]